MSRNPQGSGTIRQRKDGTWEARYTLGRDPGTGKQIQKSVYGKTQKEVRKKLTEITHSLDMGIYTEPDKITLSKWLEIWLSEYVSNNVKPFTYKSYETQCRVHIIPNLGRIKLQSLNVPSVQAFYNSLLKQGLSPKTIKNVHGVLHKALDKALKIGYINFNPANLCELPRVEKKEIKPLSNENIKVFLRALEAEEFKNLYLVALFTGMRQGEILGLTWDCVDFKNGTITINKQLQREKKPKGKYILSPTKSSNTRIITPAAFVMDILKELHSKEIQYNEMNLVFVNERGEHLAIHTVYKHFKKIMAEIGTPETRFHDLRHTYAVTALQEGDNIKTVQQTLGHATASFTLDVYGHVSDKMKKESAQRMDTFIRNINTLQQK